MPSENAKPKLVFFQWDHSPNLRSAKFLAQHMQQHVKCLSIYFDVTVVNYDCDYGQICDLYRPEITLFESGYRSHGSNRINIVNTRAHPSIPKLGLHNGDAWCDRRAGFIHDMDHWGIETFFSICVTASHYTPSIADSLFVWPNAIDPDLFFDYRLPKVHLITLTGQNFSLYPWRQKVFKCISENFDPYISLQHKYESKSASRMVQGAEYARLINQSMTVPTCGTMAREVVRKHFEIPGAMSCLIAEQSMALEAAGFVHMKNCVFANQENVVDYLNYFIKNQDELKEITQAGYDLVHSNHTIYQRPQVLEWFLLNRRLKPGQKIAQPQPFGPLITVEADSAVRSAFVVRDGLDRVQLHRGNAALRLGDLDGAERAYRRCLDYVTYSPEAKLGLALCMLHRGRPIEAARYLVEPIETTLVHYGADEPDPVEWAYYLVCLLCEGRLTEAQRCAMCYPRLFHPELERVRGVLSWLAGRPGNPDLSLAERPRLRRSVHELPGRELDGWFADLSKMLAASDQVHLVDAVRQISGSMKDHRYEAGVPLGTVISRPADAATALSTRWYIYLERAAKIMGVPDILPKVPPLPEFHYQRRLLGRVKRSLRFGVRRKWRAAGHACL